ncbi:Non-reducing end beta-L-arabinofuranosidase [Fusarium oxysporum f. sp. rapae]|uniref:Non-reducing end beta-L-arabinofuranosidase n=1 Tax=Fusarium oxysporum f. sp. rapae TaxID=485398 RepID=A0A8J5U6E1_FUSOX|nr:Non-reducing end beta-L-arabinofuranosidase [Fusarium oxysporum f. sp. rapae]
MSHPQSIFHHTTLTPGSLLHHRRITVSKTTLHTQLKRLRETGRYDCFKLQWHEIYADKSMWPVPFHLFWDSDIAKWIEGACYFLHDELDGEIDAAVRELVDMIRAAQQDDGYLNVHYTVVEPGKRWTNLQDMHELYNAGHLIEAALAHHQYYKNNLLLEPIEKYVALIHRTFGPGENQLHGYPGHPEIELALFRLYQTTGNKDAYDLSRYFIEERGNRKGQHGQHYFEWESKQRGQSLYHRPDSYPEHGSHWYCQAHQPILEQQTVEGHSVRAMYLLTAVADMLCIDKSGSQSLSSSSRWKDAVYRLWDNMVTKKMYLTGGIGAIKQWEGFGRDYFLPQSTDEGGCYAETCASIAVMMLAERLLHIELDAKFGDVMELCLYNNVMTAMSLDGKAFTIPGWSRDQFTLEPKPSEGSVHSQKGYLTLGPAYTAANPVFSLTIGNFTPRYIAPHPYTNQHTLTLARGPLVYCIEDSDNAWEDNHFKDVGLKAGSTIVEERLCISGTDEEYIALRTSCWWRSSKYDETVSTPGFVVEGKGSGFDDEREGVFVPYYLRANRGGNGHMKVGLHHVQG